MRPVLSVQQVQPSATVAPSFTGVFASHWDEGNWDDGRNWDETETVVAPTMQIAPGIVPMLASTRTPAVMQVARGVIPTMSV